MRKLICAFLVLGCLTVRAQTGEKAALLVQQQLDAYNNHDIEAFLAPYSDSVKIYNHPDQLIFSGKEAMRKSYGPRFQNSPDLHCTLMNRMVLGNTVIDQESVVFDKNSPRVRVFAMYKIANGKIAEVYFIRPELRDN